MTITRDIDLQFLFELYSDGFNEHEGTIEGKHAAGLLNVVTRTQPGEHIRRTKKDPNL